MVLNDFVRSRGKVSLRLIDENKNIFKFFRFFGLFPIGYENGEFIVHEKMCVISRTLWFLWHLAGMATIVYIRKLKNNLIPCSSIEESVNTTSDYNKETVNDTSVNNTSVIATFVNTTSVNATFVNTTSVNAKSYCDEDHKLFRYAMYLCGIFLFIIIDPVQTIILKRTLDCMTNVLKEVLHIETITFGKKAPKNYKVSKIYLRNKKKKELNDEQCTSESTTHIYSSDASLDKLESSTTTPQVSDVNDGDKIGVSLPFTKTYNILRFTILWLSLLLFVIVFVITFYYAVRPLENKYGHDLLDEWKFVGCLFFLVFPVLTTWFCIFFLGYQRKMYKILNELPDDLFFHEEHFKDIGNYLDAMHHISDLLTENIYRFTFGINFGIFFMIGTMSMYELIQGVFRIEKYDTEQYGDFIYLLPLAICVFHVFISCEHGTNLIHDEHEILEYKLKGILTSHMIEDIENYEENPKKLKRVKVLCIKFENLHPYVTIYGGFKVDYKIFIGMLLTMFGYSRILNKDRGV